MATLLRSVRVFLNSLLPFTVPSTPLWKDLLHASVLILIFYYAPRWTEEWRRWKDSTPRVLHEEQPDTAVDEHELQEDIGDVDPAQEEDEHGAVIPEDGDDVADDAAMPEQNHEAALDDIPQPAQPRDPPAPARHIGKKKAAAMARREQRRQYHEFIRSEAEAKRLADAEGAAEHEEAVFEEKRRRAAFEMEFEERIRKEREDEKRRVETERKKEWERRETIVSKARQGVHELGYVDMRKLGDRDDVEALVKASGMLGTRKNESNGQKEVTLATGGGYLVKVEESAMMELYRRALEAKSGSVSFEEMGNMLEQIVRDRTVAS